MKTDWQMTVEPIVQITTSKYEEIVETAIKCNALIEFLENKEQVPLDDIRRILGVKKDNA